MYNNDFNGLIGPALILLPPVILLVWFVATYNRLVNLKNLIPEAWSNVDTELRRRYDLIPNLVETVKAYAAHEQAVFKAVSEARERAMSSSSNVKEQAEDENHLVRSLRQLLMVSESYPELKASTNFLHLQKELVNTEDRIQAARRFYNGNVRDYNNMVECLPSSLVAGMMSCRRKDFYEIEDIGARQAISVGERFS